MKHYTIRFSAEMMSKALGVSRSGYYKWLKNNQLREIRLKLDEGIKAVFKDSKCRYGSPRVCEQLNKKRTDKKISVATVARRMYVLGLVARPKRKYVHTTKEDFTTQLVHASTQEIPAEGLTAGRWHVELDWVDAGGKKYFWETAIVVQ
jgi:HTH-like domain